MTGAALRAGASPCLLFLSIRIGPESRIPNPNAKPANRLPLILRKNFLFGLGIRDPDLALFLWLGLALG